ncbi:MAG: PucR family transcriptional regulator ligand-binding domain-containing protein [Synergistetes bacterium]|nr:PucR family transcriptional regulator ligand-binding domain-containing protein [Synergistota bacterium]
MRNELGITVKDVLQLDVFKEIKVVSGLGGLSNVVTNVNVMKVPDILNWIRPGDFLLTTGYSIKDDKDAQVALIPMLAEKKAAAIGIKPRRYLSRIPPEMIELADRYNIPLLEIPFDLSFSDIMSPVMKMIVNKQMAILVKSDEAHKKLMNIVLSGGSIVDIMDATSEIVGCPICVRDLVYGRYFFSKDWIPSGLPSEPTEDVFWRKGYNVFPIASGDSVYGNICLCSKDRELTPLDVRVAEIASMMIALELVKEQAISEVELKYESEFMSDLLSGDGEKVSLALEKAGVFGLSLHNRYVVMVFLLKDRHLNSDAEFMLRVRNRLISIGKDVANRFKKRALFSVMGEFFVMLVDIGRGEKERNVDLKRAFSPMLEFLINNLERSFVGKSAIVAVGEPVDGLKYAWKSYQDAYISACIGSKLDKDKIIFRDDIGVYGLLCRVASFDELRSFRDRVLGKLLTYGTAQRRKEIINTLNAFFECNRNVTTVSKKMFLHYNTVVYRLRKAEIILGVDLNDAEDVLKLELAIRIHKVLG